MTDDEVIEDIYRGRAQLDTRETITPAFEALARARQELVWACHYAEQYAPETAPQAHAALTRWEATHAAEWNRLKPWFEVRL